MHQLVDRHKASTQPMRHFHVFIVHVYINVSFVIHLQINILTLNKIEVELFAFTYHVLNLNFWKITFSRAADRNDHWAFMNFRLKADMVAMMMFMLSQMEHHFNLLLTQMVAKLVYFQI